MPAAGGQFAPVGQPGQDAPRGGFNGGMMQPGFSMEPDKATARAPAQNTADNTLTRKR